MSADAPVTDLTEAAQFLSFWGSATGAAHTTLTAITPDGGTATNTFGHADIEKAIAFVARAQTSGRNVYFEINETPKGCRKKPSKAIMIAAVSRHADIDPCDHQFPYAEERDRLYRLADFLAHDATMPPTAILDSGNGIQPLWAVQREALNDEAITRIETENRAIEAAVGAGGTHNIDRLLRLPGTLNFPNAKKQRLGRGISRARILHSLPIGYRARDGAVLGEYWTTRLQGSDLVRRPAQDSASHDGPAAGRQKNEKNQNRTGADNSRSAAAFRKAVEMHRAGATFEQFHKALLDDPELAPWVREKGERDHNRELFRAWKNAERAKAASADMPDGVSLDDFHALMPMHTYIYAPARAFWPGSSVDSRIPPIKIIDDEGNQLLDENDKPVEVKATRWLDVHKPVEMMTWAPGLPLLVKNKLLLDGGWIERQGVSTFNLYVPPIVHPGDPTKAQPWIEHVQFIYEDEAEHIIKWLAQRVQHPEQKINHALVLGGEQGIGKDTLLQPVTHAVGPWNVQEVSPAQLLGRFTGFLKSVILRISEAHDLGDYDRFALYEHLKTFTAAPPDVLRIDEKNLREYPVPNVCGVVITTNHKTDGIYLPADDRRHFVAWSNVTKDDTRFRNGYWRHMYSWYAECGNRHVAAYLKTFNLAGFDPKAPPPKSAAFWAIVDSNAPAEEGELADIIDAMSNPPALTVERLLTATDSGTYPNAGLADWLRDRKNRRAIPHRLEKCGYTPIRNPDAADGLFKVRGRRQAVYGRKNLSHQHLFRAAIDLTRSV